MKIELAPSAPAPRGAGSALYSTLMAHAAGLPNDLPFAQMISSQIGGASALPSGLGLSDTDFAELLAQHFPGIEVATRQGTALDEQRAPERDDLLALLLEHRAWRHQSEQWMAEVVTTACMANDHLWQDLGLHSRVHLGRLMADNFPSLAAKNTKDMKWKKFLYKQLCEKEEIYVCRAPSCEVCCDYQKCFGPEE